MQEELELKVRFGLISATSNKEVFHELNIPGDVLDEEHRVKLALGDLKIFLDSSNEYIIKTYGGQYTIIPFVYPGGNSEAPTQKAMKCFYYCREWVVPLGSPDPNLLFRWESIACCVFTHKQGPSRVFVSMTLLRSHIVGLDRTFILACCMMTLCKDHRMDWHVIEIATGRHYIWEGVSIIQYTWCELLGKFDVAATKAGVDYFRKNYSILYDPSRGIARSIKNPVLLRDPKYCDRGKNNENITAQWKKCFFLQQQFEDSALTSDSRLARNKESKATATSKCS